MSNPQPEGVPDRLLSTEDAAPIQQRATDSQSEDQWRRALIDEELPNASLEERKIWAEELQGLPLEAVRDILRMRRKVSPGFPQIGELPAILVPAPPEEHFEVFEPSTEDVFASERQLFDNLAGGIPAMVTDIHSAQCVILNNIANAGTHGFKRSQVFFEDLHYDNVRFAGIAGGNGQLTATGLSIGWGSRLATTVVDHSQGPLCPSDQPLHVAIEGPGFFQVNDGSQILYTRCGRFCLDADGRVVLSSAQRGRLLEPAICIPPEAIDLTVAADGVVSYSLPGVEPRQDAGQFLLAHFVNPQGLEQRGECLFAQTVASGAARIGNPGEEGRGDLRSGQLEHSNVTIQRELAELQRLRRQSTALHTAVRLIEPETTLLPVPTRHRPAPNEPGVAADERLPVVAPRMAQDAWSQPRRQ
jgi:flagellar basal-body rod protein FlgG